MKKLIVFMFIPIFVLIFLSCERKSDRRATVVTPNKKVTVEVTLMPEDYLDNNLLRSLDGKMNIQNSMEIVAYPWHDYGWKSEYQEFYSAGKEGLPSPEQKVGAYEVKNAKTIKDVFYSLPLDNEWKWLTQSQVVEFCLSNRNFIKNSKKDIVFFCKRDENKLLYERNLEEEIIAIIVVPNLGGETRLILGIMWHGADDSIVIFPKNQVKIRAY